jgi:hypothetical protein
VNVPVNVGDTVPAPVWFRPSVPVPEPTFAVTTQFVPLPVTEVIEEPVSPLATRLKAAAVTFVTLRLNVTFHDTLELAAV